MENLTTKQRAKLRSLAQEIDTIAQFGKGDLTAEQITMIDLALKKRELIKCSVLESSPYTPRELGELLSGTTDAIVVTTIGHKFVLFRRNREKPVIKLD